MFSTAGAVMSSAGVLRGCLKPLSKAERKALSPRSKLKNLPRDTLMTEAIVVV